MCQLCEYQSVRGTTTSPEVTTSSSSKLRPANMPIPAPGIVDGAKYTPHDEDKDDEDEEEDGKEVGVEAPEPS